jgi:hypothetical protein
MKIWIFKNLRRCTSLLAEFSVICGVIYAGLAYYGEWQRARSEASLTYIAEFNSGHALERFPFMLDRIRKM